jgi:hypothetical protein
MARRMSDQDIILDYRMTVRFPSRSSGLYCRDDRSLIIDKNSTEATIKLTTFPNLLALTVDEERPRHWFEQSSSGALVSDSLAVLRFPDFLA